MTESWRCGLLGAIQVGSAEVPCRYKIANGGFLVDVGGGSVRNDAPNSLSNITLRWMVRQVIGAGCGVHFDLDSLARAGIPYSSDPEGSLLADDEDAKAKIVDRLKQKPAWWFLEIMPMTYVWQDEQGVWHKTWG